MKLCRASRYNKRPVSGKARVSANLFLVMTTDRKKFIKILMDNASYLFSSWVCIGLFSEHETNKILKLLMIIKTNVVKKECVWLWV